MDSEFLYCFEDENKRFFKIGISAYIQGRISEMGHMIKVIPLFTLKFTPKHFEASGIISGNAMVDTGRVLNSIDTLQSNVRRQVRRVEKKFKDRFKANRFSGDEFFIWSASDIQYVKRMFKKLSESETTAITLVEYKEY
jgi:hypothetical protein